VPLFDDLNAGSERVEPAEGAATRQAVTGTRVAESLPALRRRVMLTGLVLLGLGVLLTATIAASSARSVVQRVDDWWYRLMIDSQWPPLVDLAKVLSKLFGTAIDWPIRVAVTLVIVLRRHWLALSAWALTIAVSELCIGSIKSLIDRPRPPGSLIATSASSYPSGHALASAVTAIGIVMAITTGRRRLRWMIAAVIVAAAVALSRTYLSAHWLSDVVGGSLIGAGLALTIPEAFELTRDRRSRSRVRPAQGPSSRNARPVADRARTDPLTPQNATLRPNDAEADGSKERT
jgi:membrane-associated phospholipid phosphatase